MVGVPQSVKFVSTNPASPEARPPSFLGSQPCVPVAWLAERQLLESNPGPKPTLKALSHTRTQPPTLTKYTSSSVQPPQTCPTPLLSTSPHTHSIHSRPNTTYTSRLSPHIPSTQTSLRRHPNSTHTSSSHPHTRTLPHTKQTKDLQNKTQRDKILQLNAKGIRGTVEELKHIMRTTQSDVVAIQESKLTPASRTPKIPHYTAIRTDREHKQGGGLITYIKSDTTFTHIKTPQTINTDNT